jgi:multiple sugar transport system permease protein
VNEERRGSRREAAAAWLLLGPGLAIIGVTFLLPVLAGLLLSLTDFDIYAVADSANVRLIGARNYAELFDSPLFWKALRNTLVFALVGGPLSIAASLGAALLVNTRLARFKGVFRTVYFAPVVTTLVAVAVVWRHIYHPEFGLLATAFRAVGLPAIDWMGDPRFALPAIILMAVWKNFGYNMVIFVAGLQAIPAHLYEAARLDGASAWQQFLHVTVPMLRPTSVFVGTVTIIGYLQLFAEPYVMTRGGGPVNATLSVVLLMYKEGFRWWNMGFAAAVAFVLFAVILAATGAQLALRRRRA